MTRFFVMMLSHVYTKKAVAIVVFLGLVILLRGELLEAEMYRWKNKAGQIHYSTSPPSYSVPGIIEVKRQNRWYPYSGAEAVGAPTPQANAPVPYTTSSPGSSLPQTSPSSDEVIVPYNQQDSVIIIEVVMNRKITRPFAVDTGATYTVISPEVARALALRPRSQGASVTLQTANGKIQVPLVNLESVAVGGAESPNVMAAVHAVDDSSSIAGLLGLNFLKRFHMTVDSSKHQLVLKPVSPLTLYTERDCASARTFVSQGRALHNGSEREMVLYKKAIALCPDFVEAYYHLGAMYIQQKDASHAIQIHQKILELQPDAPEAHFRLGLSYLLQRKFSLAKREFRKTLALDPEHPQAREYWERLKKP